MATKLNLQLTDATKFKFDPINIDGTIQYKFTGDIDLKGIKGSVSFVISQDQYNKFVSGAVNVSASKNLTLIDVTVSTGGKCIAQATNVVCSASAKGYLEPAFNENFELFKNDARLDLVELDIEAVIPKEAFADPSMVNLGEININTNAKILGVDSSNLNTILYIPKAQEIQQQQWDAMSASDKARAITNNMGPNSNNWNDNIQNLAKELAFANKDYQGSARDIVWKEWESLSPEDRAKAITNNMGPNSNNWNTLVEQKADELKQQALEKFENEYSSSYDKNIDGTKDTLSLENGNLTKTTTDIEGNILSSVSLSEGQTISHIAQNTPYNSIELLEYNGISLEDARNLPVGFEVHIPKAVTIINGEYGNIKLFENPDGSTTAILPNQDNITYSSENDLLIYGDYTNPNKISFTNTSTGDFEVWEKDASGSMYQSQVSNEDFSINYTPSDDGKSKIVSKIEILSDNASFEDIAPHTDFSADDIREFNDYQENETITRDSIDIPKSKELIPVANGIVVHLSGFNGNEMFIDETDTKYTTFTDGNDNLALYETSSNGSTTITLSNTDGSTRTIISNSDGYSFDSYGVSDVADINYTELPNGDLQVSGFVPKQDMTFISVSNNIFARSA